LLVTYLQDFVLEENNILLLTPQNKYKKQYQPTNKH